VAFPCEDAIIKLFLKIDTFLNKKKKTDMLKYRLVYEGRVKIRNLTIGYTSLYKTWGSRKVIGQKLCSNDLISVFKNPIFLKVSLSEEDVELVFPTEFLNPSG
jgi:hypothetical protein